VNRKDFDIALEFGEERETALKDLLQGATVEVKSEPLSKTHVFIEHEGYGKPSGIAITKAAFWAIEVKPDMWVILPTEVLRIMWSAALDRFGARIGGDKNASTGAIVPKQWLVGMR